MSSTAEDNCKEEVHMQNIEQNTKTFTLHVLKYAYTCDGHCIMQLFTATCFVKLENV